MKSFDFPPIFYQIEYIYMYILGWPKNPKFLNPTRPEVSNFFGFSDSKKPELKRLTRPDPTPNFGFRVFSGTRPENPKFLSYCQPPKILQRSS